MSATISTSTSTSPLKGVKALLFDVFGTVVNWEGSIHRLLKERAVSDGLNENEVDLLKFTRDWRAGYMRRTKAIANGATGTTNVDVLHRELLDELLLLPEWHSLALVWNPEVRTELTSYWHKLDGWNDSSSALQELSKYRGKSPGGAGVILATLSNGSTRLLVDLARHATLPFDTIFSGDIFGAYKPSPKMYLGAVEALGLKPEECGMVASHIYDLRGAGGYGLKTIYIPRETEDTTPALLQLGPEGRYGVKMKLEGGEVDVVVRNLGEIVRWLD